jgi:hypothetical protein
MGHESGTYGGHGREKEKRERERRGEEAVMGFDIYVSDSMPVTMANFPALARHHSLICYSYTQLSRFQHGN